MFLFFIYWLCGCGLGSLVSQLGIIIALGVFLRTEMGMRNTKHIAWDMAKKKGKKCDITSGVIVLIFYSTASLLLSRLAFWY